jgi:hypothetical protein
MFFVFVIVSRTASRIRSTAAREEAVIEELEGCTDMRVVSVGDEQFLGNLRHN